MDVHLLPARWDVLEHDRELRRPSFFTMEFPIGVYGKELCATDYAVRQLHRPDAKDTFFKFGAWIKKIEKMWNDDARLYNIKTSLIFFTSFTIKAGKYYPRPVSVLYVFPVAEALKLPRIATFGNEGIF